MNQQNVKGQQMPKKGPGGGRGPMRVNLDKAKDSKKTTKRLLGYLKDSKIQLVIVFIFVADKSTCFKLSQNLKASLPINIKDGGNLLMVFEFLQFSKACFPISSRLSGSVIFSKLFFTTKSKVCNLFCIFMKY